MQRQSSLRIVHGYLWHSRYPADIDGDFLELPVSFGVGEVEHSIQWPGGGLLGEHGRGEHGEEYEPDNLGRHRRQLLVS